MFGNRFLFLVTLLFMFSHGVNAQTPYNDWNFPQISLDDSNEYQLFLVDSTFQNNIWQIGNPQKAFIDSAFSAPYALVTDTIGTYSVENLSSAQMIIQVSDGGYAVVGFTHKFDSDLLVDGGCIELSVDDSTWHGFYDTAYWNSINLQFWGGSSLYGSMDTVSSLGQPGFSGVSNGWQHSDFTIFYQNVQAFSGEFRMRFLFASDSIDTQKDGWAIDNLWFEFGHIGIKEINANKGFIHPNPTTGFANIQGYTDIEHFILFNSQGRLVDQVDINTGQIDVTGLPPGFYLARWIDNGQAKFARVVVQ